MNISKFWENIYPFSVINLPHGIQGPICNILPLPKGVKSSAAMTYRISKFLTQMGRFICCAAGVLRQSRRINIKQINTGWRIYIGVSKLCHHRLRWWLVTWAAPNYLIITTTGAGSLFCEQMSVNIIKMRRISFKKMYLKIPSVRMATSCYRCRRSSSTQEQRYPPPLPLGATPPPTCGRRKSDPGLGVATQDQEYPLRKLREIRDTSNGSWCIGIKG